MTHIARVGLPPRRTGIANAVDLLEGGVWRLWLHTPDYIHGTYMLLHPNGMVITITESADESPYEMLVRPADGYDATT